MKIPLLAIATIACFGAAHAADGQSSFPVCTKTHAVWAPNDSENAISTRSKGPTHKWSCNVNGSELVVKYQYGHPTHRCSATVSITVSAWINGVKIVDRADAGDDIECLYAGDRSTLERIALDADGSARICTMLRTEDGEDTKQQCERKSAQSIRSAKRDPAFVPIGQTSKPAFDLRVSNAAFCPALTAELVPVPWESDDDPAFAKHKVAGTETWGKTTVDEVKASRPRTARFDADNDGHIDKVELDAVPKYHGYVMGELRWSPAAANAKPFTAGELPWGEPWEKVVSPGFVLYSEANSEIKGQTDYVASAIQPVNMFGRNYLYLRRHAADPEGQEWNVGEDYYATSDARQIITRGIAELHPAGTTTLVCGWGPRPRREDFL